MVSGVDGVRDDIAGPPRPRSALDDEIARLATSGERIDVWGTAPRTLDLLQNVPALMIRRIEALDRLQPS